MEFQPHKTHAINRRVKDSIFLSLDFPCRDGLQDVCFYGEDYEIITLPPRCVAEELKRLTDLAIRS